jgi:hypothetical protein
VIKETMISLAQCSAKFLTIPAALLLAMVLIMPVSARPAISYATVLSGDNTILSEIGSDGAGNIYLIGTSAAADLPITADAYQASYGGGGDIFVARLNADGKGFSYCTYIGGRYAEQVSSACVDKHGNVYIAGVTSSPDFPSRRTRSS